MNRRTKKIISLILSITVIAAAAIWIFYKFSGRIGAEFTDNAQVRRQIVPVISRVEGYIKEIRFKEFKPVHKGDTLVILDDSDLRLRLAQARAEYSSAISGKGTAVKTVSSTAATVAVTEASISEAKVLMDLAETELNRYRKLLEKEAVTQQQYDAVKADYEAKQARYEMLSRQRAASSSLVEVDRSRIPQRDATIELTKASVEQAELNLSYTVIVAPCDGFTSRKNIQTGQYVQPGQTLLDIVDSGDVWVNANFKETQLKHIKPGSDVEVTVDAIPGVTYHGKVQSISTATGAAASG